MRVKGTSGEVWCLLRLFPLILLLADVPMAVMSTNPAIRLVTKLIRIVFLPVAFAISETEAEIMQKSVEEFLTDLQRLLPSFRLTAKFHYMLVSLSRFETCTF